MRFLVIEPVKVADDARSNRIGDLLAKGGGAQQFFFRRIGDKRGFHQHRRHRRRFQYHKRRLFRVLAVQTVDGFDLLQNMRTQRQAILDGVGLYQVEQHLL